MRSSSTRSPLFEELVAHAGKRRVPSAVGIEEHALLAGSEGDGPRRGVAQRHRFGQDLLHPGVGVEGLPLLDADGGELSDQFRVERVRRLILDHGVQLFVELEVVRVNGVDLLAGEIHERLLSADSPPAPADTCGTWP